MKLPEPSAWRYTHRDYAGDFVGYAYDTEKPKNLHHPNYTPMFTAGQMNQYGKMCFYEGRDARVMVEPMYPTQKDGETFSVSYYADPPQRKPLTHEQRFDLLTEFEAYRHSWHALGILIDMVEAAHGIGEKP